MSSRQLAFLVFGLAAAVAVGVGGGLWLGGSESQAPGSSGESSGDAREPLFYRNPMNPTITSPVPAKDSMGMDYIPVYAEDMGGDSAIKGTVSIDPVVQQNMGVRTAIAEERSISRSIRTVGRIDYAEPLITRLHPKISGWIEELFVNTTGQPVDEDTILLSIYSPRLVSSQEEYLLALKNYEQLKDSPFEDVRRGAEELVASSRARLELFDVPEHQIRELEKSRKPQKSLHIHSPRAGIVMKIGAREGQNVTPSTELYMIADLSVVWAYADIFEYELPWVSVGDEAEITVSAMPGKTFRGTVDYIYPYAQTNTRTVKVRLVFDNPDLVLKPEMFAEVLIRASKREEAVVIPAESVVRSGAREQVFVVREPGKFEPRLVVLGLESDGLVEVREGLAPGEEVVTSALFLIDSESKLREAAAKMVEPNVVGEEADDMSGHDMNGDGAGGHDMSGHEMSGHDMSGHDMSGHDMSGDMGGMDMEGHDMGGGDMEGMDMEGHQMHGGDMEGHDMPAGPDEAAEPAGHGSHSR